MSRHLTEFDIIKKYFQQQRLHDKHVVLGIGDDAALVNVPSNNLLAVAIDTLVKGVHFLPETAASDIGYKALAVNLSDLAAMGASPMWLTLALTLPEINEPWLEAFAQGLFQLANHYQLSLIGGDTTQGPLTITIQVHGLVPPQQALCRHQAQVGDKIYASGTLGDAGLGLLVAFNKKHLPQVEKEFVLQRLNRPTPRVELGIALRNIATSAIDISDGLVADLNHILTASCVGADLVVKDIPLSPTLRQHLPLAEAQHLALTAGDDYELCFTVSPDKEQILKDQLSPLNIPYACIGEITATQQLNIIGLSGELSALGFQHFSE